MGFCVLVGAKVGVSVGGEVRVGSGVCDGVVVLVGERVGIGINAIALHPLKQIANIEKIIHFAIVFLLI